MLGHLLRQRDSPVSSLAEYRDWVMEQRGASGYPRLFAAFERLHERWSS